MENKEWLEEYSKLNNSFKKTLVFRVGIQAGLFSEINHLFLAVAFCLKNEIKFVMSSRDSNFSFNQGWQDYFLPFCKESQAKIHLRYNARSYQIKNSILNIIKTKLIRTSFGIDFLTQDVWNFIRDAKFQNETFNIPQLAISGNILHTLKVLTDHLWRFQPAIQQEIDSRINRLNLSSDYVGVHIRSGDKATEAKLSPVGNYINYIKSVSSLKNLFVLTDNYSVIKELKTDYPDYTIFTYCQEDEKGFSEGEYNLLGKNAKKTMTVKLITDIEILSKSFVFVGTQSSNVGIFVGMRRNAKLWYGIDANNWRMW